MVTSYLFGHSEDGKPVYNYVMENSNGAKIECTQLGASIVSIIVPDKNGDIFCHSNENLQHNCLRLRLVVAEFSFFLNTLF